MYMIHSFWSAKSNANTLSVGCVDAHEHADSSLHMSESETRIASNWKVIRHSEAGRWGTRWVKVAFTLDSISGWQFIAVEGLNTCVFMLCCWTLLKFLTASLLHFNILKPFFFWWLLGWRFKWRWRIRWRRESPCESFENN